MFFIVGYVIYLKKVNNVPDVPIQYVLVKDCLNITDVFYVTAADKKFTHLFCLIKWPYKQATDPCRPTDLQVTSAVIETSKIYGTHVEL